MINRHTAFLGLQLAVGIVVCANPVSAQSIGTLSWQLQPFCNNLTVNITQQGALFTVDGYDDQCGAGQRAPLVGVATQNPDGTIGFGLHIITVPGGRAVDVDARISLATLSGPWSDSAGNSGTFGFSARTSGLPRPLPTIPAAALTPGSITAAQLAPGAVTTATIADGSVTPQKLAVALPKLMWSGLNVQTIIPVGTNVVVRTVTMSIPAAGQVMASASGLFDLVTGSGFVQYHVVQHLDRNGRRDGSLLVRADQRSHRPVQRAVCWHARLRRDAGSVHGESGLHRDQPCLYPDGHRAVHAAHGPVRSRLTQAVTGARSRPSSAAATVALRARSLGPRPRQSGSPVTMR